MSLTDLAKRLRLAPWRSKRQAKALRANLALYRKFLMKQRKKRKPNPLALAGQPFDSFYLEQSPLFRRSRARFIDQDGKFESRFVTSPRSLSSAILLENRIQYSPTEDELLWQATDPAERTNDEGLLRLVGYSTSLFHEQSHRILWEILPPPADRSEAGLSRYLNFVESIVVGIDMALGDELGPKLSSLGYLTGTLYDPGSYAKFRNARERRNYLHVAIRSTYLALELHEKKDVRRALRGWAPHWMPTLPREVLDHAVERALRLDSAFIRITNLLWQEKHLRNVGRFFGKPARGMPTGLVLSRDPEEWIGAYLAVETVFAAFGL
jgi:hypothetical protein